VDCSATSLPFLRYRELFVRLHVLFQNILQKECDAGVGSVFIVTVTRNNLADKTGASNIKTILNVWKCEQQWFLEERRAV
jgi:hypothetical protein